MVGNRTKIYFSQAIFLLAIFLKQFYILPSGSIQAGDVLLVLSFGFLIAEKRGSITIWKKERRIGLFVLFVALINGFYSIFQSSASFNRATLYFVFNFIAILLLSDFIHGEKRDVFLRWFLLVMETSVVLQGLIYLFQLGKWYSANRYEGTFNDPNQYGAFLFMSVLLIYILGTVQKRNVVFWMIAGTLLIFLSASAGMYLGIAVLWFFWLLNHLVHPKKDYRRRTVGVTLVLIGLLAAAVILVGSGIVRLPSALTGNSAVMRVVDKLEALFGDENGISLLADRGWRRIASAPQYLIFGAGEGGYARFNSANEIHSSLLGPLFCYGIVPCLFLFSWIRRKLRGIHSRFDCVYLALLAEALFLVNYRQPFFWFLFVLAEMPLMKIARAEPAASPEEETAGPEESADEEPKWSKIPTFEEFIERKKKNEERKAKRRKKGEGSV